MPAELADRPAFVLRRVRIEGASDLSVDDLRPLWSGMIGRAIRVPELFELASRIERRYREDGIPVVATGPTQDLPHGDDRIVVFDQATIAPVEIRGNSPRRRARRDPDHPRLAQTRPRAAARVGRKP